jgi:hypothetical protein
LGLPGSRGHHDLTRVPLQEFHWMSAKALLRRGSTAGPRVAEKHRNLVA